MQPASAHGALAVPEPSAASGPLLRVRLVQVAYDDAEPPEARLERVAAVVAAQHEADLVVLPELWTATGFGYRHWDARAEPLDGRFASTMTQAAIQAGATVHVGSFIERDRTGRLYNTSLVFSCEGEMTARYRKMHRFGDGECKLLGRGEELVSVPIGDGAGSAGLATCYDLRFPELFTALADQGCDLFIVPAAWPRARVGHWTALGIARAIENQAWMLQCNTGGRHAGLTMGAASQVIAPDGTVIATAASSGTEVVAADLDLGAAPLLREAFPVLADRARSPLRCPTPVPG